VYGASLILSGEHKLKEFMNTVLKRICGPKRDEMVGGWNNMLFVSRA
jgi:hypothetical protein